MTHTSTEQTTVKLADTTAAWVRPVSELLGHISDVLPDNAFDKIATAKWNAVSALVGATTQAAAAPLTLPEPAGWRDPTNLLPSQGCTYMRAIHEKWPHIYREPLYTEQQVRALLAATQPAAQGMEQDAARYHWLRKSPNPACDIDLAKHFGGGRGQDFDALIDAAIAAQAKQGGAA